MANVPVQHPALAAVVRQRSRSPERCSIARNRRFACLPKSNKFGLDAVTFLEPLNRASGEQDNTYNSSSRSTRLGMLALLSHLVMLSCCAVPLLSGGLR